MNLIRALRDRHHGAAVEAEFRARVATRNAPRALPVRLPLARRRRWPWVLGGAVAVVTGLLLPWDLFVPLALLAVGVGAAVPTWGDRA